MKDLHTLRVGAAHRGSNARGSRSAWSYAAKRLKALDRTAVRMWSLNLAATVLDVADMFGFWSALRYYASQLYAAHLMHLALGSEVWIDVCGVAGPET